MTARESNSQLLCAQLQREKGSNHAWMCSACAWVFGVELKLVPLFFVSPNFFPRRQFFSPRKIGFTATEICVFTDNSHVCFSMAWLCSTKLDCKGSIMNTVLGMKELKSSVRRIHTWSGELEVAECKETISLSDVSNTPAQLCDSTWHSGRWLPCNLVSTAVGHCHGALLLKA